MSAHTPGPWQVNVTQDLLRGTAFSVREHIKTSVVVDSDWLLDQYGCESLILAMEALEDRRVKTAHLIAAAPDLLDALKAMSENFGGCGCSVCEVVAKQAVAAIAKAEGKS